MKIRTISLLSVLAYFSLASCVSDPIRNYSSGHFGSEIGHVERFEIGWYDDANNLDSLSQLATFGFDFTMPYVGRGDVTKLDRYFESAQKTGLGVYLEIPRELVNVRDKALSDFIERYRDNPNLRGWYLYDEPEQKLASRPGILKKAYAEVKNADPTRSVSLVFGILRLAAPYRETMDRLWFDFYPIDAGTPEFAAMRGGRYAEKVLSAGRLANKLGKPLFLILQGYGEGKDGKPQFGRRLPTAAETRYQFYASLLGQPMSLAYWTFYRSRPEWVQGILEPIIRDFRSRFPNGLIYASTVGLLVSGPRCDSIILDNGMGQRWLLIVSRQDEVCSIGLTLPAGATFIAGESVTRLELDPFGTSLLELSSN